MGLAKIGAHFYHQPPSWTYAIDVVSMSLETRYAIWVAQLPIGPKGHSNKKRSFGQLEFRFFTEAKGRLVDLLPTKDDGPQPVH